MELDFSNMESVPEIISEILECYGCLDVLIFNSSMKVKAPVQSLSLQMDRIVMDVNYFGPVSLVKGKMFISTPSATAVNNNSQLCQSILNLFYSRSQVFFRR